MMVGDIFNTHVMDVAVVPIFVNAGAVLFASLAAALATFFALLFKPKELLITCRKKPVIPVMILLVAGTVIAAILLWPAPSVEQDSGRRSARTRSANTHGTVAVQIDWTEIAMERFRAKARGDIKPAEAAQHIHQPITSDQPVIFRYGPHRLGAVGAGPRGPLTLAWDYYPIWIDDDGTVEIESNAMILSSPVMHGNRVFAASCLIDPPKTYGIVFCVDAVTGRTIWSVDHADGEEFKGFFSSPAVTADGKYVLIGQGLHPDFDCSLICIDATTGKIHWTFKTPLHLESSPAIENGVVYIGAGAIEDPVTGKPISHPGFVLAVRIADGKELWRYDVADPESSPIVSDGILYIGSGFNGNAVLALRTEPDDELDGAPRLLWKTPAPYPITGAVSLVDGKIFVGGGNGDFVYRDPNPAGVVMALDAKTGDVLWQTAMPDAVLGAIAAADYLICPVAAGNVTALDPASGEPVWSTPISGRAPVMAGAAVIDGYVYAVSQDGYMAKLALDDGRLIERVYINSTNRPGEQGLSISSPFIVDGRIFVGSETGGLRCYVGADNQ